jgi:hypothetical protein
VDSAAVNTCTGIETSPNEIVSDAIGRPAIFILLFRPLASRAA